MNLLKRLAQDFLPRVANRQGHRLGRLLAVSHPEWRIRWRGLLAAKGQP
jgi:hypothetical protein